jgi:hypothetical protein
MGDGTEMGYDKYIKTILIAVVTTVFCCYIAYGMIESVGSGKIQDVLLIVHGGYYPANDEMFFPFLIIYLPLLVQTIFYGGWLVSDYDIFSTYAFTRSLSRNVWYKKKFIQVVLLMAIFQIISCLTTFCMGLLFGNNIENIWHIMLIIIYIFITVFLFNLIIVWGCNLISLFLHTPPAVTITLFLSAGIIYLGMYFSHNPINIMDRVLILKHNNLNISSELSNMVHGGGSIWVSFLLLSVLVFILFFIGRKIVRHKDVSIDV